MVEPFVGSGAVTLATARLGVCKSFLVGDTLEPLCEIWRQIVTNPERLAREYREIWDAQHHDPIGFYNNIRQQFNSDRSASKLLFLLARCVKNAVRFNPSGEFNQSPDKRRLGTKPKTMADELHGAHVLLRGRCEVVCGDYKTLLALATPDDLVYMDPPYQGTSEGRDSRYFQGVRRDDLISALTDLNERGVQFVLSYDGSCGDRTYGEPLPEELGMRRVLVDAGRSSQETLNGGDARTVESIYLSGGLAPIGDIPEVVTLSYIQEQDVLFEQG